VLDAGSTNSGGQPFFVMELVRGVKITEFCDRNNLATPERLDLFVQIYVSICGQVVKSLYSKGFSCRMDGHCQRNCQPRGESQNYSPQLFKAC
jgi:hypothetical protein